MSKKRNGGRPRLHSDEMVKFIRKNAPGKYNKELTEIVNSEFGTNYTIRQIRGVKSSNKITSAVDGVEVPRRRPTPLGTKRVWGRNTYVRVNNIRNKEDLNWRLKHHVVWEKYHGDVPADHSVLFLDGDRSNFNIDNLKCVPDRVVRQLGNLGKLTGDLKINESKIALAKLDSKVSDIVIKGTDEERFNYYRGLAESNGIGYSTFYARLKLGWNFERAATQPVRKYRRSD